MQEVRGRWWIALGMATFCMVGCSRGDVGGSGRGSSQGDAEACPGPRCTDESGLTGSAPTPTNAAFPATAPTPSTPTTRPPRPDPVTPPRPGAPPPPVDTSVPTPMDAFCIPGALCSSDPPPETCGNLAHAAVPDLERVPSTLALLIDRSAAMGDTWEGKPRWRTLQATLEETLGRSIADIDVGARVVFPAAEVGANDEDSGAPDGCQAQVRAGRATGILEELGTSDETSPLAPGSNPERPLLEAMHALDRELSSLPSAPDPITIVMVTADEPTCGWDANEALEIANRWQRAGHRLFALSFINDRNMLVEQAGAAELRIFHDSGDLFAELSMIVDSAVIQSVRSCSLPLDEVVDDRDDVLLTVGLTDAQAVVVPGMFWWLADDGDAVEFDLGICSALVSRRVPNLALRVNRACAD